MEKQLSPTVLEVIRAKERERAAPKVKPKIQNALLDLVRPTKPDNVRIINRGKAFIQSIDKTAPDYVSLKGYIKEYGAEHLIKAGRKEYGSLLASGKHQRSELAKQKEIMEFSELLIKEAAADVGSIIQN